MQLDDNVRFEVWEPGEKVSGEHPHLEIGPFSQDVKLVGIYRDPETGAGSSSVKCSLVRQSAGVDISHFRLVKTDSLIFKADLGGGRVGLSFFIRKGEVLRFETLYSGTVTLRWIFFFSAPHVSVATIKEFMSNVSMSTLEARPAARPDRGFDIRTADRGDIRTARPADTAAAGMTMGDFIRSS